ncbi:MAG: 16S rRNA (cytosine(1402)-N(4))-methyltransferase RsmH [Clostridia bacterium]|nr:16S rRNA (cytosine(1402)-N(4))-methyltransferase RsmH [Clostridia bacterium]
MEFKHEPVLLKEVLEWLNPSPGGIFADGTLGGGGHSERILQKIGDTGTLYGIDRDEDALRAAVSRLQGFPAFHAIHGNFHDIKALIPEASKLDGGLLDLGVSSYQLDTPERGFSYHEDAPLDMRMDRSAGLTAADWLNSVPEKEITNALYDYGDEKWAARIAKMIVERRNKQPLVSTMDLVACVDAAIPKAVRRKEDGHPARRTFQAVRIAVNDEIAPLEQALKDWMDCIRPGGRLCVITFHSIEDRIVKHAFRRMQNPCVCPPQAPICICGKKPVAKVMGGGAIHPAKEELAFNSRSHSATLRVAQKL